MVVTKETRLSVFRIIICIMFCYLTELTQNSVQIQRGEHIANSSRSSRGGGGLALRRNRNRNKRQSQDPTLSDDSSEEIKLNEIETECPRLSKCVPSFFCERFRGVTQSDQIVSYIKHLQYIDKLL